MHSKKKKMNSSWLVLKTETKYVEKTKSEEEQKKMMDNSKEENLRR